MNLAVNQKKITVQKASEYLLKWNLFFLQEKTCLEWALTGCCVLKEDEKVYGQLIKECCTIYLEIVSDAVSS